jgi:hypothetical protein
MQKPKFLGGTGFDYPFQAETAWAVTIQTLQALAQE